jgi:hypothetical protein
MTKGVENDGALESDADQAAVGAMASLMTGTRNRLTGVANNAYPSLRSGLRLSRCGGGKSSPPTRSWDAATGTKNLTIPEATSPFGEIKIVHGLNSNPAKDGSSYGEYFISIEMAPNVRTQNAEQIGFLQVVRKGEQGGGWGSATAPGMSAERARRADPGTGWYVDRYDPATVKTPYYGMKKTSTGLSSQGHVRTGKFGGVKPFMKDTPGIMHPYYHAEFYVCLVCIQPSPTEPKEKDRSYGCISWGFEFKGNEPGAGTGWVEETPAFSTQAAFGSQTDRALGMEKAVSAWNTNVATAGSGIDAATTPYALGATVKASVSGGYARLRRIYDSGPDIGKIYKTSDKLMPGTQLVVLQRKVNRIDANGKLRDMTEILYSGSPGWVLHEDLDFNK